jgi:hypothetical protein
VAVKVEDAARHDDQINLVQRDGRQDA